jgi:hypothetical protein
MIYQYKKEKKTGFHIFFLVLKFKICNSQLQIERGEYYACSVVRFARW